ncbi:MAG: winged helix-turn-helix domain-containing protein [Methanosarcinales archaeon]|jgi:DNA-binding MarR family transcriptional regulator|nr:winged helix-turn-helix domain-containing protein [Methanosarcinales archaeon]
MNTAGTTAKDATDKMMEKPKSEAFEELGADSVVVIPVNDDSKKIRQILSNDTSMKIMELLKKESLSASEVSEKLGIPLTTVKYNVDQMVEYDLVRVQRIKYSEKGRQVKIYEAPEKVIVFAPETMSRISLLSMLQKYAFAFVAAAFAGFGLNYIYQGRTNQAMPAMARFADDAYEIMPSPVPEAAAGAGALSDGSVIHNSVMAFCDWFFYIMNYNAFWFIAGALFVCVAIWAFEYMSVKKNAKSE